MIYTVTLNPALDRTIGVERLLNDDTTRILSETYYAGGKGIDVSRVIRELGGQSVALGLVGGYDGLHLEGLLINAGVTIDFTRISGETRTNLIIKESISNRQFVLSAPGPRINAPEIGSFYQHLQALHAMDYLVLSGSLPGGVTHHFYGQIIVAARNKGAFVVLDTDGEALKASLAHRPACIKPNIHELSRLVGRELAKEADILEACSQVHGWGVPRILVSRGRDGLLFSTPQLKVRAVGPPVKVDSTVGAGDATVAGFVLAHARGKTPAECVRYACAAGTATAQTPGTELCHRAEFERLLPLIEVQELA